MSYPICVRPIRSLIQLRVLCAGWLSTTRCHVACQLVKVYIVLFANSEHEIRIPSSIGTEHLVLQDKCEIHSNHTWEHQLISPRL